MNMPRLTAEASLYKTSGHLPDRPAYGQSIRPNGWPDLASCEGAGGGGDPRPQLPGRLD
jgi:hypothetical protein